MALANVACLLAERQEDSKVLVVDWDLEAPSLHLYFRKYLHFTGKPTKDRFDVFLCHNSEDKSEVKRIGSQLIEKGLRPWLDEWEVRPGIPWQSQLDECINKIDAVAVFIGPSGMGPWQDIEMQAYLRYFVNQKRPVIPVILEGVSNKPKLPLFLGNRTWVDFRQNEPNSLERLIWGITEDLPGLIDLLEDTLTHLGHSQDVDLTSPVELTKRLFNKIGDVDKYVVSTPVKGVFLLKAGRQDSSYTARINRFDWETFFAKATWFFQGFAEYLVSRFDYVLIDSRTGVADSSNICTAILPDKIAAVFTPNRQSLEGLLRMLRTAVNYRKRQSDDWRPISVFPLVARLENAEKELARVWRRGDKEEGIIGYQGKFEELMKELFEIEECDLEDYFDQVQIQHVPRYSYGEEIAVLDQEEKGYRLSIGKAYEIFTDWIVNVAVPWEERDGAEAVGAGPLAIKGDVQGDVQIRSDEIERLKSKIAASEDELERQKAEIAALKEKAAKRRAQLEGPGSIAQGKGSTSAGQGGAAVHGDVRGGVHIGSTVWTKPNEKVLREAYLQQVVRQCSYLFLAGIDPAMASKREADTRLSLNAVYTALLTRATNQSWQEPQDMGSSDKERLQSALEQLDRHKLLVLNGEPGSGKSTFVRFVALCLAGEFLSDPQSNLQTLTAPLPDENGEIGEEPQSWSHGALIPLHVTLRDFAATGLPNVGETATVKHLWAFIERELQQYSLGEVVPFLKKMLHEKGGLLLLDGLDAVPEAERRREQVKQVVEGFVQAYRHCRVLVTSRTYAYQNQDWRLKGFSEAVLAPLSDAQIRRFILRWYRHTATLGRLSEGDADGRAQLLQQAIFGQPRLRELAERPLLLTLMASLHAWRGGNLPERRERLYADTVDLLLDFWEQRCIRHGPSGEPILRQPSLTEWLRSDREQVRGILEALAFEAHSRQPELVGTADISEDALVGRLMRLSRDPEANPARLVEYLRDRAGLLMPRGVGVFTFPHRSFQEYLAACHLTGQSFPDEVAELARSDPDRWREVALLTGAKAARGTAATIWFLADALCYRAHDDPEVGSEDEWGALLAAQALLESANLSEVSAANRSRLIRIRDWMNPLMRSSRMPATERVSAGDSLAVLGDPRFDPEYWYLPRGPRLGFVEIPAGDFRMGSDKDRDGLSRDNEYPQHSLILPSYYMARWPVTVAQFRAFMEDTGQNLYDSRRLKGFPNHPVVTVSWHEASAYCRWLGGRLWDLAKERASVAGLSDHERTFWQAIAEGTLGIGLPSEAEWEKAARGSDGRIYPWGDEFEAQRVNGSETNLGHLNAVGCFPSGASPNGCEEMSGNVWEWTRSHWGKDWRKPEYGYPYDPTDGREVLNAPDNVLRVLRGGAFNYNRNVLCCAYRDRDDPSYRDLSVGFRVVLSPCFSDP